MTTLNRSEDNKVLPYIIVVSILSGIVFILVAGILYVYLKNKKKGLDVSFSKKDYQGTSIIGSTATIADESPAIVKSPDPNKLFQTTQEIKLN